MSKTVHDGLHQGRFDTRGLIEDEARQAYLDRLDGILDTVFLAPFTAQMDAYRLGAFSVLHLIASERRSSRVQARIAQDRYDSIGVQYVVSGHAVGSAGKRRIVSDPGTIMILDYGQPFTVTDLEPRTVINVAVPRALFLERSSDPVTLHGAILTGPTALVLARFMETLGTVLPDVPKSCEAALARVFTDLLAVALGTVMSKDGVTDRDTRTIQRAEGLVDDRIGSVDLDPAWLAGKLNLSRSDLYAVMERFGGVARFILQRRLAGARAALENPADHRRIGAIAFAFGFSSEAHFARAFRAAFGATASEIRQLPRTDDQNKRTLR